MRNAEHLDTWQQFEARIRGLYDEHRARKADPASTYVSDLLFRGQSNADWPLDTTLERYAVNTRELLRADAYYRTIYVVKPEIETYTGRRWQIDTPPQYNDRLEQNPFIHKRFEGQIYEFMVYLRHHGFPSPLLDWSRSPYVAAFFAVRDPPREAKRVAVFAFLEHAGKGKTSVGGAPKISGLGPNVTSHRRHFLQQSEYTVCTVDTKDEFSYSSHQEAFEKSEQGQDILWKFTLPVSERMAILRSLDLHNLNSFSLFGSEESLMKTLALRELMRE